MRLDPETGFIPCTETARCPLGFYCDLEMDVGRGMGLCVPDSVKTYLRPGRNHLEVVIFEGPDPCRGRDLRVQGFSSGDILVIRPMLVDRAGELDFVQEDYEGSWIESWDEPSPRNEFTAFFRPHDWEDRDDGEVPSHGFRVASGGSLHLDVPVDYDEGIIRGRYRLEFEGGVVFEGELDTRYCGHGSEVDFEAVMSGMINSCLLTMGSIVSPDSARHTSGRDIGRVGTAMGLTMEQAACLEKVYECCRRPEGSQFWDEHIDLLVQCMNEHPPQSVECPS